MTKKKPTFEEALEQLEAIVTRIEEGDVSLEDSIAQYAEGIKLVKLCRGILDQAEEKIQLLTQDQGQDLALAGELEDLEGDDD
jgi:exodeoxyribonuclease VII small subunit